MTFVCILNKRHRLHWMSACLFCSRSGFIESTCHEIIRLFLTTDRDLSLTHTSLQWSLLMFVGTMLSGNTVLTVQSRLGREDPQQWKIWGK